MGDEYAAGGFLYAVNRDGEWEPLGEVSEDGISVDFGDVFDDVMADTSDDEKAVWADALLELQHPHMETVSFKLPWYWAHTHFIRDIFGERTASMMRYEPRYLVRDLRRGKKSHKGKELR